MTTEKRADGHKWNEEFCSCGCDACTCQECGERVCGSLCKWTTTSQGTTGNVCWLCLEPEEEEAEPEAVDYGDILTDEDYAVIERARDGWLLGDL